MSRALNDLAPEMKVKAFELLARLCEAGIPVLIVTTLRTAEEQAAAVLAKRSRVQHSRHQDGMAIDVCPYEQYLLHGDDKLQWDTEDPVWIKIRDIGEALSLRAGARFHPLNDIGIGWDPGHFEIPATSTGLVV